MLVAHGATNSGFAADDRILLGEGLFETLKVERSKPCFAELHWLRLSDSARKLGITFELSFGAWLDCLNQKIHQDGLFQGGIKAILSGGVAARGLAEHGQMSQLMLQTFAYTHQHEPIRLMSASWLRDPANPIYQHKSVNYLEAILARRQALAGGMDDTLFFNSLHHASETTCANLFLIKDEVLYTPPLTDGVLPGITRRRILSLCADRRLACREQSLTGSMLAAADAVFITNALQNIRLVRSIDAVSFKLEHLLIDRLVQELTPLDTSA
ncbi:MAG: aminotransferase class IV [Legionellales bacterium]